MFMVMFAFQVSCLCLSLYTKFPCAMCHTFLECTVLSQCLNYEGIQNSQHENVGGWRSKVAITFKGCNINHQSLSHQFAILSTYVCGVCLNILQIQSKDYSLCPVSILAATSSLTSSSWMLEVSRLNITTDCLENY